MTNRKMAHLAVCSLAIQAAIIIGILMQATPCAWAQADFQEVEPSDLLRNPKNYWSLGIIFRDTLEDSQAGRRIRLGSKDCIPFQTGELGLCYADTRLAPELNTLPLGKEYLFRGTVLTRQGSFFNRGETFVVVVQSIEPGIDQTAAAQPLLNVQPRSGMIEAPKPSDLIAEIHQDLFAFAEERDLELGDILQPDSAHLPAVQDAINDAILRAQSEQNTTTLLLMSDLVLEIVSQHYGTAVITSKTARTPSISLRSGVGSRGSVDEETETMDSLPEPTKPKKKRVPMLKEGVGSYSAPVSW